MDLSKASFSSVNGGSVDVFGGRVQFDFRFAGEK